MPDLDQDGMRDILIRAKPSTVDYKMKGKVAEEEYCFWLVHKLPKGSVIGGNVLFCDGKKIFAEGEIIGLDTQRNRILFEPLIKVNKPQPKRAPHRGYAYV